MRIDYGNIGMESANEYHQKSTSARTHSVLVNTNESFSTNGFSNMLSVNVSKGIDKEMSMQEKFNKIKEEYINLILRLLFPKKEFDLKNRGINTVGFSDDNVTNDSSDFVQIGVKNEYYYEEYEETSFNAQGLIKCADGREINFDINLNMSRSFMQYYSEEVNYIEPKLADPLVINFDGNITEFADQTFSFDIDADGVEDQINRLIEGCGFLSLDLDNDGIINNGNELFGAKSGNGFADLALYDTDKDGFIDEDDEIFEKLRIMTVDENGVQHLYSLKEKNVGAISLSNAATKFTFKNGIENETQAIARKTGFFLFENGTTGLVQQIDMAKRENMLKAYA